ncbi:hypothetical protein DY000_02040448 [Brassica cretica]|uniref:Uncharacterized protein n=1 Tax=Brassica cretica TaxID=69181 RepID=A0ABQ7BLW9_BRACR|nr:hypothetical protein DY000_02040448 [Brassica cretica]
MPYTAAANCSAMPDPYLRDLMSDCNLMADLSLLKPDRQDERMNLELHTDGRELVAIGSSSDASGTRLLPIGFASGCFLSGLQAADRECEMAVMRTGS